MPTRHTDKVRAIATAVINGQHLVISGSDDKTTLVWDLASTRLVGELATMSKVHSVATGVLGTDLTACRSPSREQIARVFRSGRSAAIAQARILSNQEQRLQARRLRGQALRTKAYSRAIADTH